MYFAYLDEAGISNPEHEPWVVVAGVLVRDRQWKAIESRLCALADEYATGDKREGFVFHAKELWSGGKNFPRQTYPAERRFEALKRLCSLISEFRLPMVQGTVHRNSYIERTGIQQSLQNEVVIDAQIIGFSYCVMAVD